MDLPSKHVLRLSRTIGPRYPGTEHEKAAASYIVNVMDDSGIDVVCEEFSAWKSDLHGLLIVYCLAIIAYLVFPLSYTASLILSSAVFLVFQMETYTWHVVSRLLPRSKAVNIIGRVRPSEGSQHRVVLVANYDSPKTSPLGRPGLARFYRVIYIVSFLCIILTGLVSILGVFASLAKVERRTLFIIWLSSSPFAIYIFALFLVNLWGEIFGQYSPGAIDNACGVGVMLSVMGSLAANPMERTEVWGVATARGSAGGLGMCALLRSRGNQLKDAFIINLDHPGAGPPRLITREGVMFGFHCNRRLQGIALRAAKRFKGFRPRKGRCRVKKSDAMVALARGRKAITIGSLNGGTYRGWRDRSDSYDAIDKQSLDLTVKLVQHILGEFEEIPKATLR